MTGPNLAGAFVGLHILTVTDENTLASVTWFANPMPPLLSIVFDIFGFSSGKGLELGFIVDMGWGESFSALLDILIFTGACPFYVSVKAGVLFLVGHV